MRPPSVTFPALRARIAWIVEAFELGDIAEAVAALLALEEELA